MAELCEKWKWDRVRIAKQAPMMKHFGRCSDRNIF